MLLYLLVCCLFISRIEINVAKNIGSITEEKSLTNDEGLLDFQSQLIEIQDDIITISRVIGKGGDLDSIIILMAITEEFFQHIQDELAYELDKTAECSETAKTLLNNHFEAVSAQLKNLQLSFENLKNKRLPPGIIEDIKGLGFNSSQETLKQLNNITDTRILKIIQYVYAISSDNLELLAGNLTESSIDIDLTYNSLKALQQELSVHRNEDPYRWMRLVKVIEAGVINQLHVNPKTKSSAQDVVKELYQLIRAFTVNALKAHVCTGAFEKNGELDNLTTAVYMFDPSHSESIIEEFVNTSFEDKEYLKDILDTILSHRFVQQRIRGIIVLFWKINDSHKIDNDVIIDIASALYKINSDTEFNSLSRSMRMGVKRIIETLPACARNLFFLPSVCLWNRAKEEYLTAGNSTFNNDKQRRNIFLTEDPLPSSQWYVQRMGDNFYFSSRAHPNEFLYAADFDFNRDLRYLFSWIPGNNTDKQSKWNIRLNGDYCYIQSAAYYENMTSSNYKTLEGNIQLSYVFTRTPRSEMGKRELQWQLKKCD